MPETVQTSDVPLTVSASAAARIKVLSEQESQPDAMLRVQVDGGGCSGFQYGFSFEEKAGKDDTVIESEGAKVVVDSMSLVYLAGSEIDFVDDLIGSYFSVKNPNATSTCGCGTSFAV